MIALSMNQTLADVSSKDIDVYRAVCGGFFVPEVRVGDRSTFGLYSINDWWFEITGDQGKINRICDLSLSQLHDISQ